MYPKIIIQVLGSDLHWQDVKRIELISATYTLGRSQKCDIYLGHFLDRHLCETVSAVQLSLYRRAANTKDTNHKSSFGKYIEAGYDARDGLPTKASTNGSYHNGKRMLDKVQLRNGDFIQISKFIRLQYVSEMTSVTSDLEDTLIDPEEAKAYVEKFNDDRNNKK